MLSLDSDMKKKIRKYADLLISYCCDVRVIDLGDFQDAGEMTKDEFKERRKDSRLWSRDLSLIDKIGTLV